MLQIVQQWQRVIGIDLFVYFGVGEDRVSTAQGVLRLMVLLPLSSEEHRCMFPHLIGLILLLEFFFNIYF